MISDDPNNLILFESEKLSSIASIPRENGQREDFFIRIESLGIFAILDGHFGTYAAQRVRDILIDKITAYVKSGKKDFKSQLDIWIREVESALEAQYHIDKKDKANFVDSGTTLCIIIAEENKLTIANIGDSKVVIFGKYEPDDHQIYPLFSTLEHSTSAAIERMHMSHTEPKGGSIKDNGLLLTRCLGSFSYKIDKSNPVSVEPDFYEWDFDPDTAQFFILATKSFWSKCKQSNAMAIVEEHIKDSDFGAKHLVAYVTNINIPESDKPKATAGKNDTSKDTGNTRGSNTINGKIDRSDDVTVIVVVFKNGIYELGHCSSSSTVTVPK